MNKIIFDIYLSLWQRLPIKIQIKLSDALKNIKLNPENEYPPLPVAAVIDPINICNLDCPLCASKTQNYKKSIMSFAAFQTYLDKIPTIKVLVLFNWGEPFLNKDIFRMINYAVKKNIYTIVHSNFSLKTDDGFFNNILDSGLHQLVISADGATQESYSKYRVKGDFELVFRNMSELNKLKKSRKKRDPKIIWKFLVNRYNEDEIEISKKMAKEIGVEILFEKMGLGDDLPDIEFQKTTDERKKEWLPKNRDFILDYYQNDEAKTYFKGACNQLFQSIVINPDGRVSPCCWITDESNTWGDLNTQTIEEIWYNDNYIYSRNLFNDLPYNGKVQKNICTKCNIFERKK